MTDIDFEELDKAVSSLMNQRTKPNQSSEPSQPTSVMTDSGGAEPDSRVSSEAPVVSAEPEQVDSAQPVSGEPVAPSPAIRRTSGRFMDVVHPSSDMRSGVNKQQAPSQRPPREASPLQPIAPQPDPVQANAEKSPDDGSNDLHEESYGDLEMTLGGQGVGDESVDTITATNLSEPNASADFSEQNNELSPMQSPFLADVEVDKRPLGGDQDELQVDSGADTPGVDTKVDDSDGSSLSSDVSMPDPLDNWQPPEADDSGSVEAPKNNPTDESADALTVEKVADDTDAGPAKVTPPELSAEVLALESDTAQPIDDDVASSEAAADKSPAQPVSGDIPTQYKASDTEGPEPSAVFEAAAEEPRELQHPAKKKSGWLVIVWILLLLMIGAGTGVAVWFFLLK